LLGEKFPGGEPVGGLGAVFLHLDEDVRRGVAELDAGGDFVDVLAAGAAGMGEGFLDAGEVATEGGEVGAEVVGREGAHLSFLDRRNRSYRKGKFLCFCDSFFVMRPRATELPRHVRSQVQLGNEEEKALIEILDKDYNDF
jgi:hypothetical protein